MVTALWAGECMVQCLAAGRDFPLLQNTHSSSGAHSMAQSVVPQQVEHKDDHSPPSSAKVANECSYIFIAMYTFMACSAGLYCYHNYKSMTSRKDGYLFVVEYFMQYNFIICLDKIFRHKSPKPLFYNGHLKSAEPSSGKTQTCSQYSTFSRCTFS
jgi:hypothetical protein